MHTHGWQSLRALRARNAANKVPPLPAKELANEGLTQKNKICSRNLSHPANLNSDEEGWPGHSHEHERYRGGNLAIGAALHF
jgi:hypothetical protein